MTEPYDNYDPFEDRAQYEYRFCLWPHRCHISGRWLWLTTAMYSRAIWHGPGEPVIEQRWYHRDEALMLMIKKVRE